mmetsp:Transcript_107453/g.312491  ORF Transcript_107453/g.312491 Transcript_107453/m.312491 type:complete len:139 (-) Transcript_107453:1546-1962(-)
MGLIKEGADLAKFEDVVSKNFASGRIKSKASRGRTVAEKNADGPGGALSEKAAAKASQAVLPDFQLPAEYAFVARALQQMDGVGKELDPEFEFIASVAPAIVELKGADVYVQEQIGKSFDKFLGNLGIKSSPVSDWFK